MDVQTNMALQSVGEFYTYLGFAFAIFNRSCLNVKAVSKMRIQTVFDNFFFFIGMEVFADERLKGYIFEVANLFLCEKVYKALAGLPGLAWVVFIVAPLHYI